MAFLDASAMPKSKSAESKEDGVGWASMTLALPAVSSGASLNFRRCDLYQNLRRSARNKGCFLSRSASAILLLLLTFCVPAICKADDLCPWLNAATAAGALRASVTATVTRGNPTKDDATCEFIHREAHMVSGLRIEVETMKDPVHEFASYAARCKSDAAPLRAIGNEALSCSFHGNDNQVSEQVVGRVRDRAFIVRLSSNGPSPGEGVLHEEARKISEQVAGILF
jgi:hypothetical protein